MEQGKQPDFLGQIVDAQIKEILDQQFPEEPEQRPDNNALQPPSYAHSLRDKVGDKIRRESSLVNGCATGGVLFAGVNVTIAMYRFFSKDYSGAAIQAVLGTPFAFVAGLFIGAGAGYIGYRAYKAIRAMY